MTFRRFMLASMFAGGVLLATGCRSMAGNACLKQPDAGDIGENPPLRIPVGLDPVDSTTVLKVPPPVTSVAPPPGEGCLESPPRVEKLVDAVADEKAEKKRSRRERSEARSRRTPGKTPGPKLQ